LVYHVGLNIFLRVLEPRVLGSSLAFRLLLLQLDHTATLLLLWHLVLHLDGEYLGLGFARVGTGRNWGVRGVGWS